MRIPLLEHYSRRSDQALIKFGLGMAASVILGTAVPAIWLDAANVVGRVNDLVTGGFAVASLIAMAGVMLWYRRALRNVLCRARADARAEGEDFAWALYWFERRRFADAPHRAGGIVDMSERDKDYRLHLSPPPGGMCGACGEPLDEGEATSTIHFADDPKPYHFRCWPGKAFPVPDGAR